MNSRQTTSAISAIPIGAPGCPEFAFCTASIANTRIAFAIRRSLSGVVINQSPKYSEIGNDEKTFKTAVYCLKKTARGKD